MKMRAMIAAVLATALGACSCGEKVQKVDPSVGELPDELPFGAVAVGDDLAQQLTVSAVTAADLTLAARVEEADAPFRLEPAPSSVPGNGAVDLVVTFSPAAVDTYAGTLVIETNDPDRSKAVKRIVLSGVGKSPQIEVKPAVLDLSAIACPPSARSERCVDQDKVVVENVGEVRLTLGEVKLVPDGDGARLPVGLALARLVSTSALQPGEKLEVPVRWKPVVADVPGPEAKDFRARLVIPSNDPAKPRVEVPVAARAEPNQAPSACISVLEITRRAYAIDAQGQVRVTRVGVPVAEYTCASAADQCVPGEIQVRPGMTVRLTAAGKDAAGEPCSADPEGDAVAYAWDLPETARPAESRTKPTPDSQAVTELEIDAVGRYVAGLAVRDSLLLAGRASLTLNAVPRDDIAVQLSWQDAPGVDLDLHLLADAGPNVTAPAAPFCTNDCFFYNPAPNWFTTTDPNDDPRLLRDDQGGAGQLESLGLPTAPKNSRYRVLVHEYARGSGPAAVTPKVTIRLKGATFGPFSPTTPLAGVDDTWVAATIRFPEDGSAPSATASQEHLTPTDDPDPAPGFYTRFQGSVGACP